MATFCIVFATVLILSSYSFYVQRTLINNQLIKKGQVLVRLLSASVLNHLMSYDYYTIKLLFDPLDEDDDIISVALIGPDNFIKMHTDMKRIGEYSDIKFNQLNFKNDRIITRTLSGATHTCYLFFYPVYTDQNRTGFIQISMSDRESLLLIESFRKQMVSLTLGVLITAILAGYLISRQISNPIIELSEDIKSFMVKRHDYPVGNDSKNEITMLKNNFRTMMTELENSIEFRVKNEKMAVLGNLSSVLAHEVKNPLEPIKGSAEILKLKNPDNADILKYTGIIQSEVSELITFLDSFLDVAQTTHINMTKLDICQTLKEILILLEYSIKKEGILVTLNLDKDLVSA